MKKKNNKVLKLIDQAIEKAFQEKELSPVEIKIIETLNESHRRNCPNCRSKGGFLSRLPEERKKVDKILEKIYPIKET